MAKSAYGRAVLCFLAMFCMLAICLFSSGCGKHSGNNQATTTKTRDIVLLVFVDRSGSIKEYQHGGLDGIRKDYEKITQGFVKPILQKRDNVSVEARAFVRNEVILFEKKVDKWEQIRTSLQNEIKAEPYSTGEASKTLFSDVIGGIHDQCKQQPDNDFYVLILSDGHPDEPFKAIRAAADKFAADNPGNLKALLIAPVQPDMKMRWRENLSQSITPLGACAFVCNDNDFRTAAESTQKTLGGK